MNWIKEFMTLFVVTSWLLVRCSSESRLKLQPEEKYKICLVRKLFESHLFNEEDKDRMKKIMMETDLRMHEIKANPVEGVNSKTLLQLFSTALACVAIDCNSLAKFEREQACIKAIKVCSEALVEPFGDEILKEIEMFFSTMNREMPFLDTMSDKSTSGEAKKKERLGTETNSEKNKDKIRKEVKGIEKKENETKKRLKRASVANFRYQAFRTQSNPTLESIIADKLLESTSFRNFFTGGLSQEDAVFFSKSMVESSLSGYRKDIIEESKNAVTNSLYRLGLFPRSRDYAFAIGRSIASVFAAHELTFYVDGLNIGSSLVYQLESMLESDQSSTFSISPSFDAESVSGSSWGFPSAVISGHSSGMSTVQVSPSHIEPSFAIPANPSNSKSQFQTELSYYLSESQRISETFCSGTFPHLFEVINLAFTDYGYPIASSIATMVSNSLSMLPTEAACAQYPEVISEIITDILDDNRLISTADPQTLTNKISDLISTKTQRNPSDFGSQTFTGSDYELNPSFSGYSDFAADIPAVPIDQYSDTAISSSAPFQKQEPVQRNPIKIQPDSFSPVIPTSSQQMLPIISTSAGVHLPVSTVATVALLDYPSDFPAIPFNQSSDYSHTSAPIILESGPVLSDKLAVDIGSASEYDPDITPTAPKITEVTDVGGISTPLTLDTSVQTSTVLFIPEVVTPSSQDGQHPEFRLKALNNTSIKEETHEGIPKLSVNSTDVKILLRTESPSNLTDLKAVEKSPGTSLNDTTTEVQASTETPIQKYGSSGEVKLSTPQPITDEVSALVFAEKVASVVTRAIAVIRSQNFQIGELCDRLNSLAPLVDLPPLDVCSELPLIDYLLHVLNAVTYSLAGE